MLALWCRLVEVISIIPIFICPPMVKITVISGKIRGKIMAVATVVTSSMQQRGTRPLPAPSLSFHFCCFENGCRGAFPEKALSAILCDIPRYTRGSNWRCPAASYSWIGLPIRADKKTNLPANQKGYDNSKTTIGKLLARRTQIFQVSFLCNQFWPLF